MKALIASVLFVLPAHVERVPTHAVAQSIILGPGYTVIVQSSSIDRAEWAAQVCSAALRMAGSQQAATGRTATGTFLPSMGVELYDIRSEGWRR